MEQMWKKEKQVEDAENDLEFVTKRKGGRAQGNATGAYRRTKRETLIPQ